MRGCQPCQDKAEIPLKGLEGFGELIAIPQKAFRLLSTLVWVTSRDI